MTTAALDEGPILNGPYDPPERYFELSPRGPTGVVRPGRRPSESFVPVTVSRKGAKVAEGIQTSIDVELTTERRERNTLINDIRHDVERWRLAYDGVTPTTRTLLEHWADPHRENRVLFCQREAVETAIFLHEVAGRRGYADWRTRLSEPNAEHNAGLPRVALKMATGAGKTVVMAMLIAWQTANKVASPRDARFTSKFLVVAPGITIKDRLKVLLPGGAGKTKCVRKALAHGSPDPLTLLNQCVQRSGANAKAQSPPRNCIFGRNDHEIQNVNTYLHRGSRVDQQHARVSRLGERICDVSAKLRLL